jgi:hypothetical protein
VAGSAAAVPPLPGAPLTAPLALSLPAKGKAVFYDVTLRGEAKVAKPKLTPVEAGTPNPNIRAAAMALKPHTVKGAYVQHFYVAIGDVSTSRVLSATAQGDALDLIVAGAFGEWKEPPTLTEKPAPCAKVKEALAGALAYWQVAIGATPPHDIFVKAFERAGC